MNQSYIYAALLIHEEEKELNQDNITTVLESVNIDVSESKVKALISALEDVDIEDALRGDFTPPKHPREQLEADIATGERVSETVEPESDYDPESETDSTAIVPSDQADDDGELETVEDEEEGEGIDELFSDGEDDDDDDDDSGRLF